MGVVYKRYSYLLHDFRIMEKLAIVNRYPILYYLHSNPLHHLGGKNAEGGKMKKLIYLFGLAMLVSGCATAVMNVSRNPNQLLQKINKIALLPSGGGFSRRNRD